MISDQPLYLVVVAHRAGPYIPETMIANTSREVVLDDIETGQFTDIVAVLEIDLATQTSREVTNDPDIQRAIHERAH